MRNEHDRSNTIKTPLMATTPPRSSFSLRRLGLPAGPVHPPEKGQHQGHAHQNGKDVRHRLNQLHAGEAPDVRQHKGQGQKEDSLAAAGKEGGGPGLAGGLEEHVAADRQGQDGHHQGLVAYGRHPHHQDERVG